MEVKMPILEEALSTLGPCLTSELAQELVKQGISAEAARQRISRRNSQIATLSNIVFPHKARFIYFKADFESEKYWKALTKRLAEKSPTYGLAMKSLMQRNGMMPLKHFYISCGSPVSQKGHVNILRIFNNLLKVKVITQFYDSKLGECIKLTNISGPEEYRKILNMRARIFVEDILCEHIRHWIKSINLSSYNKITLRTDDELPKVGTYYWDLAGPSYLYPLRKKLKNGDVNPGFVICDILLNIEIDSNGVLPFINKYKTVNSLKNINSSLYFIVANKFSLEALRIIKSKGIIPATPENLFGKEIAKNLKELFNLLLRITQKVANNDDIDKIYKLLNQLGKIEGAALNLRGALFPFLIAELFRSYGFSVEKFGHNIKDDNSKIIAEVDLIISKGTQEIVYIECKGNDPGSCVNDNDVNKWLHKLQIWRNDYLNHSEWNKMNFRVEFWATGIFSETAQQILTTRKKECNRDKWIIDYFDNNSIAQQAKAANNPTLFATLKEHFLRHPLSNT